ncbi:MAG: GNAT family N-acetyltransferase [Burkholderiales bacterium]
MLLGCGALKELDDARHGEVKSMRTPRSLRRRGAGRAVLAHILDEARRRGYTRLSLETGRWTPSRRRGGSTRAPASRTAGRSATTARTRTACS